VPHLGEHCSITELCVDSYCDTATMTCTAFLPDGAQCTSARQCESYACINAMCAPLVDTGHMCTTTSACKQLNDVCSTSSMTCVPVGLTGAPCTTSSQCSSLYTCGTGGTCVLKPRLGETCDPQTSNCIDTSYCDTTTLKCTAPKADGQSCTSDRQCVSDH